MTTKEFKAMLEDLYEGYDATVTNGQVTATISYNMHNSHPFALQTTHHFKKTFMSEEDLEYHLNTCGYNWIH